MAKSPKSKPTAKTASRAKKPASSGKNDDAPKLELGASPHFNDWLAGHGISLAFTSQSTSKLFLVGRDEDGLGTLAERTIDTCGSLIATARGFYVSAAWQIWRFENVLNQGEMSEGYDAVYVPKASHVTGAIACRDMALDAEDRLVFANGRFSCLAYLSRDYSFHPVWRPPFISAYAPEDRCRLSGLAAKEHGVEFVTAGAATDGAEGWRESMTDGGILIDVRHGETVAADLCLPAAPRLVGKSVLLIEGGSGFLTRVDPKSGTVERITRLPGFPTAMTVIGNFAVVGLSKSLPGIDATSLPLTVALTEAGAEAKCGVAIVELSSGNVLHWVAVEGVVEDIAGICSLPGITRPRAVGFKSDEIARTISLPPDIG